jgi:SpoVK/Ycf46/Vps4 family AAA+-type ATPase
VGKTALVRAVAADARALLAPRAVSVIEPDARALASHAAGAPERALRAAFGAAARAAAGGGAAILFLDEIDALAPARDGGAAAAPAREKRAAARRVAQLLTLLDGSGGGGGGGARRHAGCLVVAATNRPAALDAALRRPGRLDVEITISPPDAAARADILRAATARLPLTGEARSAIAALAAAAAGAVGADIAAAAREAAARALRRSSAGALPPQPLAVMRSDLEGALARVGAASLRGAAGLVDGGGGGGGGDATSWACVGGADEAVSRLRTAVEAPIRHVALFARVGLAPPRGVLLHGPPGNSKTTLARALSRALGTPLFALTPADVLSAYVGEAERILRGAFARARAAAPSILLLDEIDALVGVARGGSGGGLARGFLATLLTELDGVAASAGVLVIGATNRPAALDPALLRPGRLSIHISVQPPNEKGRKEILAIHSRRLPLAEDVDFSVLSQITPGWSGARLEALCRGAALVALREAVAANAASVTCVNATHFSAALLDQK